MIIDIELNIKIIEVLAVRAPDDLALSSKNRYLTDHERKIATILNQVINNMAKHLKNIEYHIDKIIEHANQSLIK